MNPTVKNKLEDINSTRKWLEQKDNPFFKGRQVKEISDSKWFIQSDAPISYDASKNVFSSELKDQEHTYLSFQEMNTNFSIAPDFTEINLQSGQSYEVKLSCEMSSKMDIALMIVSYSDNEKTDIVTVRTHEKKEFTLPANVNATRFALRVAGSGSFKLNNIQIGDILLWSNEELQTKGQYKKIEHTEWYFPNKASVLYEMHTSTFNVELNEKEFIYLPYNEANVKFSEAPINPIKIDGKNLAIVFNGYKDSSVDVKLALILYKGTERKEVHQVDLNTKKYIKISDDIDTFRLAVRIAGTGMFSIESIIVSGKGYWLPKNFKDKMKNKLTVNQLMAIDKKQIFGWDKSNQVIFHSKHSLFESRLIGKQYQYLPCF